GGGHAWCCRCRVPRRERDDSPHDPCSARRGASTPTRRRRGWFCSLSPETPRSRHRRARDLAQEVPLRMSACYITIENETAVRNRRLDVGEVTAIGAMSDRHLRQMRLDRGLARLAMGAVRVAPCHVRGTTGDRQAFRILEDPALRY